jgi:asparaginyl-tRNA synthetase
MADVTDVLIRDLKEHVGAEVRLHGWLANKRSSGKIQFLIVRDGSGQVQAVAPKDRLDAATWEALQGLGLESSLVARGRVRADPRAPGGVEVELDAVEVVHASAEFPIGKKEHGVEFLMSVRHLWLRSRRQQAILRVRAAAIRAIREYFDSRGFVLIDSPILTPNAVEGTSTLFEVDYHGDKAYLSQSGHLYLEPACQAFGKVYCFGPTFRAEKSKTRRHLLEFWMVEPEVAFLEFEGLLDLCEDFLVEVVGRVLERCRPELTELERDLGKLEAIQKPFPRRSYDDCVAELKAAGNAIEWGGDFGAPDETVLASRQDRPLIVHRFPSAIKAFYMKPDPQRPDVALGADILAPEGYGEIIGGGQRLDDLGTLERRLQEHGLDPAPYQWYLDVRRYGSVPHSGFGLGVERLVAWLCKLEHIREAIPYPRTLHQLYP